MFLIQGHVVYNLFELFDPSTLTGLKVQKTRRNFYKKSSIQPESYDDYIKTCKTTKLDYYISSNKHQTLNKHHSLISTTPFHSQSNVQFFFKVHTNFWLTESFSNGNLTRANQKQLKISSLKDNNYTRLPAILVII